MLIFETHLNRLPFNKIRPLKIGEVDFNVFRSIIDKANPGRNVVFDR
jgi:hypothetical protein